MVLHYDESELNGLAESTVKLYESFRRRQRSGTARWAPFDETNDTVTATGITSFALLSAGFDDSGVAVVADGRTAPSGRRWSPSTRTPSTRTTQIVFEMKERGPVHGGRVRHARPVIVTTLATGIWDSGRHEGDLARHRRGAGQAMASGVYFCRPAGPAIRPRP